jgi:class 3 adenylate cyclase
MSSFSSAATAIEFSSTVQQKLRARNESSQYPFRVSVGISAGEPLTRGSDDLFGATVQIAARLCAVAEPEQILVSSVVHDLCAGKRINFEDRGQVALKGFPEPAHIFAVNWLN